MVSTLSPDTRNKAKINQILDIIQKYKRSMDGVWGEINQIKSWVLILKLITLWPDKNKENTGWR
jgi:hypothetical protein